MIHTGEPMSDACGHHCGTKDGQTRHCMCPDCHAGTLTWSHWGHA